MILAALWLAQGCYLSHERRGGRLDAATDAQSRAIDTARDLGPEIDAASCERIAGFRRCDEACPIMCAGPDGPCNLYTNVCRRHMADQGDGCAIDAIGTGGCHGAWLCAHDSRLPFDPGYVMEGTCMPPEFCVDAPAAGVPIDCFYTDGTRFVQGPPAGSCPESNAFARNCGGVCGDAPCERGACLGVSEDRRYGLCTYGTECLEELATDPNMNGLVLRGTCARLGSPEECVCLIPMPQILDPAGLRERGFAVPRSACLAYVAENPGYARCVDGAWSPI